MAAQPQLVAAALGVLLAQQAAPASPKPKAEAGLAFEVAAVKRNVSGEVNGTLALRPGGYFRALNFDVFNLIAFAFRTKPRNLFRSQIIGAPDWTHSERYDVDGKMSRELFDRTASDQFRAPKLVRSLLEDRFKMIAHAEQRELPVYSLVRVRAALKAVDVDCDRNRERCAIKFVPGHLTAGAITMDTLAAVLSSEVQRLITDHTGMNGRYDVDLEWSSDSVPTEKASIFTAMQEQLGLKLDATRELVEVVVVEHIERPIED